MLSEKGNSLAVVSVVRAREEVNGGKGNEGWRVHAVPGQAHIPLSFGPGALEICARYGSEFTRNSAIMQGFHDMSQGTPHQTH